MWKKGFLDFMLTFESTRFVTTFMEQFLIHVYVEITNE